MKRIILMVLLVAAAVVGASAGEKRNLATDAVCSSSWIIDINRGLRLFMSGRWD